MEGKNPHLVTLSLRRLWFSAGGRAKAREESSHEFFLFEKSAGQPAEDEYHQRGSLEHTFFRPFPRLEFQ